MNLKQLLFFTNIIVSAEKNEDTYEIEDIVDSTNQIEPLQGDLPLQTLPQKTKTKTKTNKKNRKCCGNKHRGVKITFGFIGLGAAIATGYYFYQKNQKEAAEKGSIPKYNAIEEYANNELEFESNKDKYRKNKESLELEITNLTKKTEEQDKKLLQSKYIEFMKNEINSLQNRMDNGKRQYTQTKDILNNCISYLSDNMTTLLKLIEETITEYVNIKTVHELEIEELEKKNNIDKKGFETWIEELNNSDKSIEDKMKPQLEKCIANIIKEKTFFKNSQEDIKKAQEFVGKLTDIEKMIIITILGDFFKKENRKLFEETFFPTLNATEFTAKEKAFNDQVKTIKQNMQTEAEKKIV